MVGAGRTLPYQSGRYTAKVGTGVLLWILGFGRRRKLGQFLLHPSQLPDLVSFLRLTVRTRLRNLKRFGWALLREGRQQDEPQ